MLDFEFSRLEDDDVCIEFCISVVERLSRREAESRGSVGCEAEISAMSFLLVSGNYRREL